MVAALPPIEDPALVVGLAPFDDAAVYRLSADLALVSTTDFFPPLVDDPDDFGTIAAANAMSDVFAMGAEVATAVSIAAFPEDFPPEAMATILAAATRTVADAGGVLAGGHTIRNPEPIFGLAVQGSVHPDRVWRKQGARPGDVLLLSKPLGTGVAMAGAGDDPAMAAAAIAGMRALNRSAAAVLAEQGDAVHAVTDVTGYGVAGHGWEMAERSEARLVFGLDDLPRYPGVDAAVERGVRTGGDPRNRDYAQAHVDLSPLGVSDVLCYDPQTSGGLLAAVAPAAAAAVEGQAGWCRVGAVEQGSPRVVFS